MKEIFVAKWYHLLIYPDWLRRLHQRPGKFLGELVKPGMTVADIGCGLGFYTREMALMVGEKGRVFAVDFQPEMLDFTERKVKKAAVSERVEVIRCTRDDLIFSKHVDFALSMWVAHEVPDRDRFFRQIRGILRPDGRFLLAEPNFHVGKELYKAICDDAERAGLKKISEPRVGGSRAALFTALSEQEIKV
ncbi:MAG: class I SAM-dependent methyltransferase [Phycisphaerae bacterium]|nr:class I SAM-dependent methyltransferase [Phycisphaerae bacterium]